MALKNFFLILLIAGSALCVDQWLIQRSCNMIYCDENDLEYQTIFPNGMTPHCKGKSDKALYQEFPVITGQIMYCTPNKDIHGVYYKWFNQTDDTTITEWRCSDEQCSSCAPVAKTKAGSTATKTRSCSADKNDYTYIVKGRPQITDFYKKQSDPKKNWYLEIADATTRNYYPYQTVYVIESQERVDCLYARCDGNDKVVEYYGQYTFDESTKSSSCDLGEGLKEAQEEIPVKGRCLQL